MPGGPCLVLLLVIALVLAGTAADARPAELGVDEAELDRFRAAIGGSGPGVVVVDGYLVYTWGDQAAHGGWASASKAVLSTLLFFAPASSDSA